MVEQGGISHVLRNGSSIPYVNRRPMQPRTSKILITILSLSIAVPLLADRTMLKPGWNLFSPKQDVEMGQQVSKEAESQLQILNDSRATAYVNELGRRLASHAPNNPGQYPFQFKIVNDKAINAFALPGGFIYVNRGTFEAASNEAELAGVIGHEIGHVVLRHGTNQVSKAYALQAPLGILGGMMGSNSVGAAATQLGVSFAASTLILKYSRDAESQADLIGTQILYDSGYDPKAMSNFFEKLQAEAGGGGRATQFFSDHPNPENRIGKVNNEIVKLGGAPPNAGRDSNQFQEVKRIVSNAPAPRTNAPANNGNSRGGKPARPSTRLIDFRLEDLQLRHPDNWKEYGQGSAATLAPDGGIISGSLAYGMLISTYEPHDDNGDRRITLTEATDQLISDLRQSNPQMRVTRSHESVRVAGQNAMSTELSNQSPASGRETDVVVVVGAPDGTFYYFVGVAPQADFAVYGNAFEDILNSVRFR
jgi:Zn-dependent protease with chaperone function